MIVSSEVTGRDAPNSRRNASAKANSEELRWSVSLLSFDLVWQIVSGPVPFARAFAALDSTGISLVRSELESAVTQYQAEDGALVFPMACRLFWGRK